jgi:phosphoglycolate phosphatase
MHELYGMERATEHLRVAGGTDRALARTLLERVGAAADDLAIDGLLKNYLGHLQAVLETRRYYPVGDVQGAVAAMRQRGVMVGLATGNVRKGAEIKLASAGLSSTFHLDHGGFGSDAEIRADIVRQAMVRCAWPRGASVVVIGDTEHDVRAGRAVGARVVGVATDDHARAELMAAGADAIVDTCGDALLREVLA